MPLIPAFWRQRQLDLCEFKVSLVYRVSSRTAMDTQRNPVSKYKKQQQIKYQSLNNGVPGKDPSLIFPTTRTTLAAQG